MKHAETVTFGGSGLDRAAELRGSAGFSEGAETIVLWRGKALVTGDETLSLVRLRAGHDVLSGATPPHLLGREGERLIWAHDISHWAPDDLDEAALGRFFDPSEQRHPGLPEDHRFVELRASMIRFTPRDAELAATAKSLTGWHLSHRFCACCGVESMVAMAGWQRDCPACHAHHFPRTDPVVIMLITHGDDVLMGRSPGWPEGMYSLLAGFVEPGETLEAAVRREVFEEAGIRVGPVSYLASQPWPFPASLMFGCRGLAESREITIDPVEIEDAKWLSREDMMQAFAGDHPTIAPARAGSIAHFLLRNWLADTLD